MKKHYVDSKAGKANRRLLCPNAESIGWAPRDIDVHQEGPSRKRKRQSPPLSVVNMKTDPNAHEPIGSDGLVGGRGGENVSLNANQFRPSVQLSARLSTINDDDEKVSHIITITLTGAYLYDASAKNDILRCDSAVKTFVVGTISGNAKLDILPLHDAIARSSYSATSSTSLDQGVELYLDILGKRTSRPNDTTTVHRPDWMTPLPLSIIVVHRCWESGKMNDQDDMDGSEQMTRMPMNVDDDKNEDQKVVMRIRLRSMDNTKLSDYCYHGVFPTETYALRMIPSFAPHFTNDAREACVTILESWREAMDKIIDDDKCDKTILICGAKGSGKSTFLRYAANRLLSAVPSTSSRHPRVAILDLDCGQPELGVPGTMSLTTLSSPLLMDPPGHIFCGGSRYMPRRRSQKPDGGVNVASYFFGDVTSKADPDTYVEMASRLMQRYREIQSSSAGSKGCLPLLANMDGWVKGLGYELLSAIVGIVNPGHLVQIVGNTKAKSFDMSAHLEDNHGSRLINPLRVDHCRHVPRRIHAIQSFDGCSLHTVKDYQHTGLLFASTSNHRAHRQCTYFLGGYDKMLRLSRHCVVFPVDSVLFHRERGLHDLNSNIGLVLASLSPYAVPFGSVKVYPPPGLLDGTSDPKSLWGFRGNSAAGNMHGSLSGSVVGLCQEPETFDAHHLPVHACIGLGIIRSIDQARKIFFLLTPVCPSLLAGVTSLVCGNVHLPRECVYRGIHTESLMYMSCGQSIVRVSSGSDAM